MELAMFEEFASGWVEHQKSFWTTNKHQCLTEVCKTVNLCRLHSFAETCKTDWLSRGPNGFGGGNVESDTFLKWLSSSEECKWGQRTKVGIMGDGLQVERTGGGSGNRYRGSITTLGEGALLKLIRWGVAWKQGGR